MLATDFVAHGRIQCKQSKHFVVVSKPLMSICLIIPPNIPLFVRREEIYKSSQVVIINVTVRP